MARNKPPSFDFYPDDFVGGTMGMHPCARGIYITLLCHQWSHGAIPSPSNIRQLVQITGAMPNELEEHLPEVLNKFEEREDGSLANARLDREYARKVEIREKRSGSGKAGANAKQVLSKCLSKCSSKSSANLEVGSRKKEVSKLIDDAFDNWWSHYPKKVGKEDARKAYAKALTKFVVAPEIAAVQLLEASLPRFQKLREREPQFVPHAATWLNSGGWDDDLSAIAPKSKLGALVGPGQVYDPNADFGSDF